jgi:CHAT domain-containing protein
MSRHAVAGIRRWNRSYSAGARLLVCFAVVATHVAAPQTIATDAELGHQHASRGDYALAIDAWVRALDAPPASLSPAEAAAVLNDLGGAYLANDDSLLGLAAFADSARLATEGTELAATALVNALRALHENGGTNEVATRLGGVRGIVEALAPTTRKAELLLTLGELERELAANGGARRGNTELARQALALAESGNDLGLVASAHGELALEQAAAGAHADALDHTRRAVLLAQRAGLQTQQYRFEWQLGRLLRDAGRTDDAVLAYGAAVATLDSTAVAAVTTRRGFRRYVLPLYAEYADLMLAATRGRVGEQVTATLRVVQRHVEALRLAEVRNYFENQCSVPDPALAAPAAERTVVIYPLLFADRLELLVSTAADLRQITVDVSAAELTAVVNLLRNGIERSDSGLAYLPQARMLYDWIVAPLDELLAAAEPSTLVFVPDGPLRTIPLAVLHDGQRFLVERYALATTPGLSLVGAVNTAPVARVLVNGLIEPTQGFAGLPFVADELRSIERSFPARIYADEDFVTATLEREIVAGGYSIVHMATHAQFESDYRRSFLLSYDDVITMDKLEEVMGSQRFTDRPVDLLVLSACQTAAGDERAALGLAGVAVKAGARSALASLWAVNDESTAKLVGEFYRRLADDAGKAAALRGAQLLLLNDERYSHPAYWAPFLMIGDWR